MAKKSIASYAFLLLVVILAISEIATVKGKLCEKLSQTWSGKCDAKNCDKKCIGWEKAQHGACHKREGKEQCFCYFDCAKKPPSKGGSPPPSKGGSPPPPADGGSPPPPPADGGSPPPPADGGSPPPPAGGGSPPPPSQN